MQLQAFLNIEYSACTKMIQLDPFQAPINGQVLQFKINLPPIFPFLLQLHLSRLCNPKSIHFWSWLALIQWSELLECALDGLLSCELVGLLLRFFLASISCSILFQSMPFSAKISSLGLAEPKALRLLRVCLAARRNYNMETLRLRRRLRLEFEDPTILTTSQRLNGLYRCLVLVEPTLRTISDLVSHLRHTFHLSVSCPNGIMLSMDGFVLPHFESTTILRDKDLVRVKRLSSKTKLLTECGEKEYDFVHESPNGLDKKQEGARITPSCLQHGTKKVSVARSTSRTRARRRWLRAQRLAKKQ